MIEDIELAVLGPADMQPARKILESGELTITNRILQQMQKSEFSCPICLETLTITVVTECFHRFCKECITRHLRQVETQTHECPLCRERIRTSRCLRPDLSMDSLIALLYRKQPVQHSASELIRTASVSHNNNIKAMRQHQQHQQHQRQQQQEQIAQLTIARSESDNKRKRETTVTANTAKQLENQSAISVMFALVKHPLETTLSEIKQCFIRCSEMVTANIIKRLILSKIPESANIQPRKEDIEILISLKGSTTNTADLFLIRDDAMTLRDLLKRVSAGQQHGQQGHAASQLVLLYKLLHSHADHASEPSEPEAATDTNELIDLSGDNNEEAEDDNGNDEDDDEDGNNEGHVDDEEPELDSKTEEAARVATYLPHLLALLEHADSL